MNQENVAVNGRNDENTPGTSSAQENVTDYRQNDETASGSGNAAGSYPSTNENQLPEGDSSVATDKRPIFSMDLQFPIEVFSPVPQGQYIQGQGKRKQKARKSDWHLTSTPNLEEVKAKHSPNNASEKRKRQVTKTLFDADVILPSTSKEPEKKRKRVVKKPVRDDSSDEDFPTDAIDDEVDCACIYCNDLYSRSKPGECWLKCTKCALWAHASCADVPKKTKNFVCELCL